MSKIHWTIFKIIVAQKSLSQRNKIMCNWPGGTLLCAHSLWIIMHWCRKQWDRSSGSGYHFVTILQICFCQFAVSVVANLVGFRTAMSRPVWRPDILWPTTLPAVEDPASGPGPRTRHYHSKSGAKWITVSTASKRTVGTKKSRVPNYKSVCVCKICLSVQTIIFEPP